jgi:hypothetical protein
VKSFGQQFVESEAFGWLSKNPNRPERWEPPGVEIPRAALARWALTEDPASGGALAVPDYQPTIQLGATLPIVVADLLAPGTTNSNSVPVMVEKTFTNNAAPTLEGALKPESALTFELQTEPVRKLAHFMRVGAFKTGAQIFRHGGVRVAATNSHSDWFRLFSGRASKNGAPTGSDVR